MHPYIDVLAQPRKNLEKSVNGKPTRVAIHEGADFRLVDADQRCRAALRKTTAFYRSTNGNRQVCLEK